MKEASPNPILAVFVGKASRGTAFCFAFFFPCEVSVNFSFVSL